MPSKYIHIPRKQPDKMDFDEVRTESCESVPPPTQDERGNRMNFCFSLKVFMVNLKRRADRRERMLRVLYEQNISCKIVEAVDGK